MRKHMRCALALICFGVLLTGCGKVDSLVKMDVSENTTMVMKDGTMQSAIVESFDQEY